MEGHGPVSSGEVPVGRGADLGRRGKVGFSLGFLPRITPLAVMTTVLLASMMRLARASAEKPPKTTE